MNDCSIIGKSLQKNFNNNTQLLVTCSRHQKRTFDKGEHVEVRETASKGSRMHTVYGYLPASLKPIGGRVVQAEHKFIYLNNYSCGGLRVHATSTDIEAQQKRQLTPRINFVSGSPHLEFDPSHQQWLSSWRDLKSCTVHRGHHQ